MACLNDIFLPEQHPALGAPCIGSRSDHLFKPSNAALGVKSKFLTRTLTTLGSGSSHLLVFPPSALPFLCSTELVSLLEVHIKTSPNSRPLRMLFPLPGILHNWPLPRPQTSNQMSPFSRGLPSPPPLNCSATSMACHLITHFISFLANANFLYF